MELRLPSSLAQGEPESCESPEVSLAQAHLKYSFLKDTLRGRKYLFQRDMNNKLLSLSIILTLVAFLKDGSLIKFLLRFNIFSILELFMKAFREANGGELMFKHAKLLSVKYLAMATFACLVQTLLSPLPAVDSHGELLSFWQLRVVGERQPISKLEILWYDIMIMGLWVLVISNLCNFELLLQTKSLANMRKQLMDHMSIDFLATFGSCDSVNEDLLFQDGFQGNVVLDVQVKRIYQM